MQQRKISDFKRSIKALATQEGWLVEIGDSKGPTERLVIYQREDGEIQRIATIVLRADQKEIKPVVARQLVRKLQRRMFTEVATAADEPIRKAIETLMEWIQSWF